MNHLLVNEIFGPVWQGEGPNRGKLAGFIRLGMCNLACYWCDTPHAVFFNTRKAESHEDKKHYDIRQEITKLSTEEIVDKIVRLVPMHAQIVISGGEPLLQTFPLIDLINKLYQEEYFNVSIETAGTVTPQPFIDHLYNTPEFVVSPKLESSGNEKKNRYKPECLSAFNAIRADFKFVVVTPSDLDEVEEICNQFGIRDERIWIMPEGRDQETVIQRAISISEEVLKRGWNLTLRDHVIMFGNQRGK